MNDWTPEYLYELFHKEFPDSDIEIDWRPTYKNNVRVSTWFVLGVRFPPVNGNVKGDYCCHGLDDNPNSGCKIHTLEELIDYFRSMREYYKRQPKHYIPHEYPKPTRPSRPIVQLELEAAQDKGPNMFEVTLRGMLEAQLGTERVTTERVNRYLSMSRQKMYLLLEGIGCKEEQIQRLKELDL